MNQLQNNMKHENYTKNFQTQEDNDSSMNEEMQDLSFTYSKMSIPLMNSNLSGT